MRQIFMIYLNKIFFKSKTQIISSYLPAIMGLVCRQAGLIMIICVISVPFFAQNRAIDSLQLLLRANEKKDTNRIKLLNDISWEFIYSGNLDLAMKYAQEASSLGEKIISLPSNGYTAMPLASAYNTLGVIYSSQGNYPEALKKHFAALKIRQAAGNHKSISSSFNNIGIIYYLQDNFSEALKYYMASLKILEEIDDEKGIADIHNNIGNIYTYQHKHAEALKHYFQSLKIREKLGEQRNMAACYNNIGAIYQEMGDNTTALQYHFRSLEIGEKTMDMHGIAASCINIGDILRKEKKFNEALRYLEKAGKLAPETGELNLIKDAHQALNLLYADLRNYNKALEHYKLYIEARDSLFNEENTKKTVQAQMQYAFDKKESLAKAEQEKKDLVAMDEKRKRKMFLWFTVSGLGLVLAIALLIFRSLQINKKKNKIITEQKRMVEKQKDLVEEKQKEILDSIYYAKRIQTVLLPTEKYIERNLGRLKKS